MVGLIAHEWIAKHGGSENVAEAMGRAFPDADVYTLWSDAEERMADHRVRETWLARTPLRRSKAAALPFMSSAWRHIDVSEYDFVLASSHVFAHHVGGAEVRRKYAYVHTPARTIWAPDQDSRGANALVRALSPSFRRLDLRFVSPTVEYAANSRYIQRRIASVWGRDSVVIHPPVDVSTIRAASASFTSGDLEVLAGLPSEFVLGASRFVPYKRLDLVLSAAQEARLPAVLAGSGPMREELERLASQGRTPVHFVESPSDGLLHELYRRSKVFVFPAVEDFGIMPVEAMAAGTPVVVYREGGASESVEITGGGVVVNDLDAGTLAKAIQEAARLDVTEIPERVEQNFGEAVFAARLLNWMDRDRPGAVA